MAKRVRRKSYKRKNTLRRRNTIKRRKNTLRRRNTKNRRSTKNRRNTLRQRRKTMRGGSPVNSPTLGMKILTKNIDPGYDRVFVYRTTDEIKDGLQTTEKTESGQLWTLSNGIKGRVVEGAQDIITNKSEKKRVCKVEFPTFLEEHFGSKSLYVGTDNIILMKNLTADKVKTYGIKHRDQFPNDQDVLTCKVCNASFTFMKRKHHCRDCGSVVCNACSTNRIRIMIPGDLKDPYGPPHRVCDDCFYPNVEE